MEGKNINQYIYWLFCKVETPRKKDRLEFLESLFEVDFICLVDNDDNRIADGLDLRRQFQNQTGLSLETTKKCSLLEVMIGLSERMNFQVDIDANNPMAKWFWELVSNLQLEIWKDGENGDEKKIRNSYILTRLVNRDYKTNGSGGLFPLITTEKNQRRIELWYQMMEYLETSYPI